MTYIPEVLRQQIIERADNCCEYCLIHQSDSLYTHEIDHIIPEKHRGQTHHENLCLACFECNRYKGSDFSSFDPETGLITPLFNPRQQAWIDHFSIENARIISHTREGRVTVFILKLNSEIRLRIRRLLIEEERYPHYPNTD